jgi:sugar transferase (PEP-CTERM system associated)
VIKVLNQYFPGRLFVLVVSENLLILLGIWAVMSYQLRGVTAFSPVSDPAFFVKALLITGICQLCLYYADTYDLRQMTSKAEIGLRVMQALGAAALLLALLFYFIPAARLGQGIVEMALIAMVLMILCWRILIEWLNRTYGPGERLLLVGSGDAGQRLAREIAQRSDLPLSIIGMITEEHPGPYMEGSKLRILAPLNELHRVIQETNPNRVIVALRERRSQLPVDVLLHFRMRGLLVEDASSLYQTITGRIPVESIHPSSLIFSDGFEQSRWRRVTARSTDLLGALIGLSLSGPVMLLVALAIRLESKGPILYRQLRVGLNGRHFDVLKFRSMRDDAESETGPVWARENDPRMTRVGRIIRKLRLDELPQFFNVLRGDMSFVGPRPERPHFVELLKKDVRFYDLRHSIRPGITGWAQVSFNYGSTLEDAKHKLEYDLFYIKNNSLSFDCLVVFQTIKIVLFGRGSR